MEYLSTACNYTARLSPNGKEFAGTVLPPSIWIRLTAKGRNEWQHAADSTVENLRFCDEAEHEIAFRREIVEMSGLHQNACLVQQRNCKVFVRTGRGDAQYSVPAAFDFKPLTQLLRCQLRIQCRQVLSDSVH